MNFFKQLLINVGRIIETFINIVERGIAGILSLFGKIGVLILSLAGIAFLLFGAFHFEGQLKVLSVGILVVLVLTRIALLIFIRKPDSILAARIHVIAVAIVFGWMISMLFAIGETEYSQGDSPFFLSFLLCAIPTIRILKEGNLYHLYKHK